MNMQVKAIATGGIRQAIGKVRLVRSKNDIPTGPINKYVLVLDGPEVELDFSVALSNAAAVICQTPREIWLRALGLAKKEKRSNWLKRIKKYLTKPLQLFLKIRWLGGTRRAVKLDKIICLFEECLSHLENDTMVKIKTIERGLAELTILGDNSKP